MAPLTRLIRYGDHIEMSWKNGGGQTREIARQDDSEGLVWRLSLATITKSGPFSLFPGLDRIIALIEGPSMVLHFEDGETLELNPAVPRRFSCDRPLQAHLPSSEECRDLNLLFRRSDIDARAETIKLSVSRQLGWTGVNVVICFALSGIIDLGVDAESAHTISAGETFICNNPDPSTGFSFFLKTATPGAELVLFMISPARASGVA
ncbi:HutD family protein [Mesorhizobium sp. CO1-1-11]|uniref:HutD/Ves family protein n=1 Tax=Mesorhizobium sp. CO1-1-11 TaxID=2876636 RepID=UPI001CCD07D4|nr:HutD family protein [Mesorhizobium sp. CO1-1-11]MBZ9726303.1 HutD family protein [Mesorhizobium sp. CO1-1-11]